MQYVDRQLTDRLAPRFASGAAAFVIGNAAANVSRRLRALTRRGLAPPAC